MKKVLGLLLSITLLLASFSVPVFANGTKDPADDSALPAVTDEAGQGGAQTDYSDVLHGPFQVIEDLDEADAISDVKDDVSDSSFSSDENQSPVSRTASNDAQLCLSRISANRTTIDLDKKESAEIFYDTGIFSSVGTIEIVNEDDFLVRTIYENKEHTITSGSPYWHFVWDMTDNEGNPVPAGAYKTVFTFTDGSTVVSDDSLKLNAIKTSLVLSDISVSPDPVDLDKNQTTRFLYRLNGSANGTIGVYDSTGTKIRTLYDHVFHDSSIASYWGITWNLKDDSGNTVSPGTYTVKLYFTDGVSVAEQSVSFEVEKTPLKLSRVSMSDPVVDLAKSNSTRILYELNTSANGTVGVYDSTGAKIRTLYDHVFHDSSIASYWGITWNLKDDSGNTVSPGTYTVKLYFTDGVSVAEQWVSIKVEKTPLKLSRVSMSDPVVDLSRADSSRVLYELNASANGTIGVYNSSGAKVRTLYDNAFHDSSSGTSYWGITWNLKDDSGNTVSPGTYTVKLYFTDGVSVAEQSVSIEVEKTPLKLSRVSMSDPVVDLSRADSSRVLYELNTSANGTIDIYNSSGAKVRTLYDNAFHDSSSGTSYWGVTWNLKDDAGNLVAPGTYTVKLYFTDGVSVAEQSVSIKVEKTSLKLSKVSLSNSNVELTRSNSTRVLYELNISSYGTIGVYDSTGTKIRTLYDNTFHDSSSGTSYWGVTWNLKDDAGNLVAPGTYTFKLSFTDKIYDTVTGEIQVNVVKGETQKGIDVSEWNGTINWQQVANDDIDFAMIRTGYGRYDGQEDEKFEQNYAGAVANGIAVGVYHYSYAQNVDQAIAEAQYCLRILNGRKLNLPVAYDIEDPTQTGLSKATATAMAKAFCDTIRAGGYDAVVYSYASFLNDKIDYNAISDYGVWVAHTGTSKPDYQNPYEMWQYSHTGSVNGISGNVDMNYYYGGLSKPPTTTRTATVTADSGLNVRSGPGTNYPIVDGLSKGSKVTVLEQSNGWCKISTGWVSAEFLRFD